MVNFLYSLPSVSPKLMGVVKNRKNTLLKKDWCKLIPLALIISIFSICGLAYALSSEMDNEANFFTVLIMMVLGTVFCVFLLYLLYSKCKKHDFCYKDIKVSRIFNKNNGDDYIDIDY